VRGVAVEDDWRRAEPEREAGEVRGADPVHVADVPSGSSERVSPAVAFAPARRTKRRSGATARARERDLDVLQVVVRDRGERDRAVQRQPLEQRRIAPRGRSRPAARARARGRRSRRPRGRRPRRRDARSGADSVARRSPTCPRPTTTTWSERGTRAPPDEAGQPAADQALDEPPVNARGEEQRDEHAHRDRDLEPLGPSWTSGFGSTVTSVLTPR
jgi:hypothetical protein